MEDETNTEFLGHVRHVGVDEVVRSACQGEVGGGGRGRERERTTKKKQCKNHELKHTIKHEWFF